MNVFYSLILELDFFSTVRAQFIIYIKSFPYYSVSKRMIILYVLPLPRASTILFTPSSVISTYLVLLTIPKTSEEVQPKELPVR